jgi:hypothetical protein
MKTYIFSVLSLLCSLSAFGQELETDSATMKLMYCRVVTVDSASAGQLYELARQWMARAYVSADDVIQYENKEEGKIIGRGVWMTAFSSEKRWHVLTIECKDGRARYTFTDFVRETNDATLGKQRKELEKITFMKKANREEFAKDAARMGADLEKALMEQKGKDSRW